MIGFALGFFGWLAVSTAFARCAYRAEYRKIFGTPAPVMYGGDVATTGHATAHRYARAEAYQWFALWAFFLLWEGMYRMADRFDRIVCPPPRPESPIEDRVKLAEIMDPTEELIKRLDEELRTAGYEEAKHGPLNSPCPCGYRTECPIHCGAGACHTDPGRCTRPRWQDPGPEIIYTKHPEKIIPSPGVRYDR